jgi:hypothetical protein
MVAFPLAPFLMRAGITALGAGAAGEGIKSLQNINPDVAEQAFLRTIIGPISDIFNRTTDTPSGKVFAPTGEVIEPNQIPGIAPPEQQQGITGLPIPEQQQGITGLPIPEKAPGLPGLINPEQVDTSILNKEETTEQPLKPEETKNQVKTWETMGNFKNIEEAKQRSEKAGIPFDEVELAGLKQQITFKKARDTEGYDVFFDGKLIGNLDDITSEVVERDGKRFRGMRTFNLGILNPYGVTETEDTYEGVEQSKKVITDMIAKGLLKKDSKEYGSGLRRIFEDTEYDKKGYPITEDQSVNLKGLVSRSVGQEKGMKAIREIYNDDNFLDILNPDQQKYINNLEYSYVGGVGDLGNPIIPHIFDNPMLEQNQEYMQDYQQKLANLLEKNLGKKFPVYRLMDKKTALAIVTGDLPDIKTLQEDPETGESVLKEYTFEGPFGKQTIPQEFMGFSLSPKEALAFRDFSFSGARGKKDEDFVLMEYTTIPTNAVMRGHEGEKEIVFRTVDSPLSSFELYDIKFTKEEDKRDVQLKKNKDFENLKKRFNK